MRAEATTTGRMMRRRSAEDKRDENRNLNRPFEIARRGGRTARSFGQETINATKTANEKWLKSRHVNAIISQNGLPNGMTMSKKTKVRRSTIVIAHGGCSDGCRCVNVNPSGTTVTV